MFHTSYMVICKLFCFATKKKPYNSDFGHINMSCMNIRNFHLMEYYSANITDFVLFSFNSTLFIYSPLYFPNFVYP